MKSPVITRFADMALAAPVQKAIEKAGYEQPTPIQSASIPPLLEGRDLLGTAQTGTGKTAAFALPLLSHIDLSQTTPQVLVLTPTRELAIQVAEAFQSYASFMKGFHVLPIYGGQAMGVQLNQLKRGVHVVVGTPGRVMDHLRRKTLKLDKLTTLVLDEADEMLRMGFIEDVEWILEHTPKDRQTALFSATMPKQILSVANRYLNNPVETRIKDSTATGSNIEQYYWIVSGTHKLDALTRILEVEPVDGMIIFVRTKVATEELAGRLEARGYSAAGLNGDMNQAQRERTIANLKNKKLDIVIATDVAARGIDVPRVSHVINYDIPYDSEAYVHRIGRTGRAGRKGKAILFVVPREKRLLRTIERATRQPITPMELPSGETVTASRAGKFKNLITEAIDQQDLNFFNQVLEEYCREHDTTLESIAPALAYLAQRDNPIQLPAMSKTVHSAKETKRERTDKPRRSDRHERSSRGRDRDRDTAPRKERKHRQESDEPMVNYRIEVGRDHNIQPKDIVGAIANEAGLDGKHIGHIKLFDDYSTVELPEGMPKEVFQHLRKVRIGSKPIHITLLSDNSNKSDYDKPAKSRPASSKRATSKPDSASTTARKDSKKDKSEDKPEDKSADKSKLSLKDKLKKPRSKTKKSKTAKKKMRRDRPTAK